MQIGAGTKNRLPHLKELCSVNFPFDVSQKKSALTKQTRIHKAGGKLVQFTRNHSPLGWELTPIFLFRHFFQHIIERTPHLFYRSKTELFRISSHFRFWNKAINFTNISSSDITTYPNIITIALTAIASEQRAVAQNIIPVFQTWKTFTIFFHFIHKYIGDFFCFAHRRASHCERRKLRRWESGCQGWLGRDGGRAGAQGEYIHTQKCVHLLNLFLLSSVRY